VHIVGSYYTDISRCTVKKHFKNTFFLSEIQFGAIKVFLDLGSRYTWHSSSESHARRL